MILDGEVVLVSGAARGMGSAHARRAASAGARVVLGDVDVAGVEPVAEAIGTDALAVDLERDHFLIPDGSCPVSLLAFLASPRIRRGRREDLTVNLVSVRLITDDVARLVGFYEQVTGVTAWWATDDFAELRTTSGTLAIGSTRTVALFGPGVASPAANRTAIVEFIVDDLDGVFAALAASVAVVQEPTTMPWGNRSLLLRDPDGTLVNLFEPVSEAAVAKFAATPR